MNQPKSQPKSIGDPAQLRVGKPAHVSKILTLALMGLSADAERNCRAMRQKQRRQRGRSE